MNTVEKGIRERQMGGNKGVVRGVERGIIWSG